MSNAKTKKSRNLTAYSFRVINETTIVADVEVRASSFNAALEKFAKKDPLNYRWNILDWSAVGECAQVHLISWSDPKDEEPAEIWMDWFTDGGSNKFDVSQFKAWSPVQSY